MNRAPAPELRKALLLANTFVTAGLLFVPMPVLNEDDHKALLADVDRRLETIEKESE